MLEPGEVRPPVEGGVEQGGREREDGLADGVLDQPHPQGTPVGRGLLAAGLSGRCEGHDRLVAVGLDEGLERRVGVALQAEHGVQAALGVGVQQGEGVVAAVIDDDVAGGEGVEMQPGGTALVSVGVQAEVDRQAGVQPVQAAEQALRVVSRRGGLGWLRSGGQLRVRQRVAAPKRAAPWWRRGPGEVKETSSSSSPLFAFSSAVSK